ncbi:MAG TPA: type I DNA topoisomerase [Myxococcales bacterium]|nr:type I DNA topoisomerase [Myxococcales bacterium]
MANYLVVVESPAKAKTIKKYLGTDYTVKASVGHVKDLPKSKMGVDIEKDFEPVYEVIRGKSQVLKEIKQAAKKAEKIFLATDPDREGEAIAFHIAEEVGGPRSEKVSRVMFNEITKRAIQEAFKHPRTLDERKFDSQQARRVLDRLVGYQISPILWSKIRRGLSAGRVQSVAVRLVVEREEEIKAFVPQEYWTLDARLAGRLPPQFTARLVKLDGKKAEIKDEPTASRLVAALRECTFVVDKVEKKERRRNPPAPYITAKLQQDAANRLRFTAKRTMGLAQKLYEGIELGDEGAVGLITYMRTDSARLSQEAVAEVREYIEKQYGRDHLPESPNVFKSKGSAQEAHEAIRPTSVAYPPERVKPFLDRDSFRLYKLIWDRFVACQMQPAVYDQTTADIGAANATFRATGSRLRFPGWLSAYGEKLEDEEPKDEEAGEENKEIPPLESGEALGLKKLDSEQHFTQPPPRFTEASLVKELEEKGIGRPSTYAAILSTIQDKEYVAKEENRFKPTELGGLVTKELVRAFPHELDIAFTAELEGKLDEIEEGKFNWIDVLKEFYGPFKQSLSRAEETMRDIKREEVKTELKCEKCGAPMVIKWGKLGRFLACSGYPECKNTKDFREAEGGQIEVVAEEAAGEACPNCGKPMVIKRGRFGRFMACSAYPECKTSKPVTTGVGCPECKQGQLAERRSKRGKVFYSCNRYPECKFALWDRPIAEPCPKCGAPFLVAKFSKQEGEFVACANKECDYRRGGAEPHAAAP